MQLDLSSDFQVWDNTTALQYQNTSKLGSQQDHIPTAKRRAINKREQTASNGAYQAGDVVFIIPAGFFLQGNPRQGDIVTHPNDDSGEEFTVLGADGGKLDAAGVYQTWKLTCRNLVIAFGLHDTINIELAGITYDAAGAAVRLWPTGAEAGGQILYEELPCRVQPDQADIADERGRRGQQTNYTIFVSKQLPRLDVRECRILWQGKALDILSYRAAEQIGELPQIKAVRKV